MKPTRTLIAGLTLLTQALISSAYAVPVTLSGTDVDYTFDDALVGLYGQPTLSGDTLYFTPTQFSAQSSNGQGYVLTPDTFNIRATAHAGQTISSASFDERGDYLLQGTGSSADVTGQLRVFDTANPSTDMTASISPSSPLTMTGVPSKNWAASTTLDVSGWNSAGPLNFTVENLLLASTTDPNSLAFVQKKYAGLTIVTSPVPEPQDYALILAGLGLVGFTVARSRYRVTR
jgi:hypothetical protein